MAAAVIRGLSLLIDLEKSEDIYEEVALHDSVNLLVSSFEGVADNIFLRDDSDWNK